MIRMQNPLNLSNTVAVTSSAMAVTSVDVPVWID